MANKYRGEINADLDGQTWCLCLTLGALAELEGRLGVENLGQLANRIGSGKLSSTDLTSLIACGLRGGGHSVSDDDVREMRVDGGLLGYTRIAADLITATFSPSSTELREPEVNPPKPQNP